MPSRPLWIWLCAASLAWAALPAAAAITLPTNFVNDLVAGSLSQPRAMAFLPDGRLLFTEQRTGRVRMIVNGHVAATDPLLTVTPLNIFGVERGLQGIAVDPSWPGSPYVYLFYNRTGGTLQLVRYTASGDLTNPAGENVTLSQPRILIDFIPDLTPNHNSGCLRFGPDKQLYLSLGEDDDSYCLAQDSTSLRGAIVRLKVDQVPPGAGSQVPRGLITPPNNPLSTSDSNARLVWAYGLRNPWSFHIDPATGTLYAVDVGEASFEEVDEILPGDNLGWPYWEGPLPQPRAACPEPGGAGSHSYKLPILAYARDPQVLVAFFSAGVYRPNGGVSQWPGEYNGDYLYGEYYTGSLRRLKKSGGVWATPAPVPGQPSATDWGTGLSSAADFQVGPDGALWWIRQFDDTFTGWTGSLNRIRWIGPASVPPPKAAPLRLRTFPNPSGSITQVSFTLPAAARVRVEVCDLAGRRIRELFDGDAPAGENLRAWDGLDARGRPVAPGLYLLRLEGGPAGSASARLLRIR